MRSINMSLRYLLGSMEPFSKLVEIALGNGVIGAAYD